MPGSGLIAAGKRGIGKFVLVLFFLALAAVGAAVVLVPNGRLLSYSGDRQMLMLLGGALAAGAVIWIIVALATHRALEPHGLPAGKRLSGALVVVVAASLVVAPLSIGANNMFTQRDVIGAISGGQSHTTPQIKDEKDPWADIPRLNVLLLGGDGGEGRDGIRPDTLIVASIDTKTGETTTISLPRNLQHFPFPEESPLSEIYPYGWDGESGDLERMLNATWKNLPADHPEAFEGSDNPHADATKWAVEGALDIEVDYFAMVNLAGFQAVVNALGGITVDVPRDLPIGNKEIPGTGTCTTPRGYVKAGEDRHLDGAEALWFARSRCGSSDYDRMARQQCVIKAVVGRADPAKVLTQYQSLASAAKDTITTDVPDKLFPALIELLVTVQKGGIESVSLDNDFFAEMGTTSANPDYEQVHEAVAEALEPGNSNEEDPSDDETPGPDETPSEDNAPDRTEASSTSDNAPEAGVSTVDTASDDSSTGDEDGSGENADEEEKVC